MALDLSPLGTFLEGLAGDATAVDYAWQAGVGVVALLLGWCTARVVTSQVKPSAKWKFGEGDFERVAYPLFTYVFVVLGALVLSRYQRVAALDIVASLLVAWIVIRIAVYVLGHVLPPGGFLRGSIRTIAWIAWIGAALYITGLLPEVIASLDSVGVSLCKDRRITLWLVLQALAALAFTLALAGWISRITENRVLAAQHLEMSTRVVITKAVRVATLFVAILVALPMVGIDITALSIFSGALGVGLGFGLQKIASSYVSGFIVLLDRSLRIGDLITVDGRRGTVTAIESRYTVIREGNGTESIVPNDKLITESVSHHSFTDPKVVVVVAVVVAYDTDVERALAILLDCAGTQERLLQEPAPVARVKALRDLGVELELVGWIESVFAGDADLKSDLMRAVLAHFRAENIGFAVPRQDVRVMATPETLESPEKTRA